MGIKVSLMGTEISKILGTPVVDKPAPRQTASFSSYGNEADPHLCENSIPMELNSSEGREAHDSSSHSDKNGKNTFLRQVASTNAKYYKLASRRLEQGRLETVNRVLKETVSTKSPPRGWRQMATYLFQEND
ncbi:hypothetical protein B9Z19DRAFT_1134622 [Tuber borchii]|uniref:Uncharacterized protein n=1 Tax=Tuber borchii TaxID=42251 RepID=A0A2T6ZE69_TUBBO|nr:hypothetical protein B9Z19DRAFT_1134622 [Tuber borchii]